MRNTIITLFWGLGSFALLAQEPSFRTQSFISKPAEARAAFGKKIDSAQYRRVLNIYNRLVQARGDFRYPVPSFNLVADEQRVAGIDYDQLNIVLEEKALGVCNSFGADADAAIAFLLAHELTHYYEKHAWRRGFADENRDLKISMEINKLADDAANETEADYLGGFLAYSAGYGVFKRGAEIIQGVYRAYGLKNEIPGYPSLNDRQTMSQRTAERLSNLVDVFEMANLLAAIGKYNLAYDYYRYLLTTYQSREIYNNLGVTLVLETMDLMGSQKYRYPIEMDLESSAEKAAMLAPGDRRVKEKFQQAILHFDAAISLDPNYAPAYLNKATVYALMGDLNRARFYANVEAMQASKTGKYPKTEQDINVLLGIIEARSNAVEKARVLFKKAESAGSALAKFNLLVLQKQPLLKEIPAGNLWLDPEKIENKTIDEIAADLHADPKKTVVIKSKMEFLQTPSIGTASNVFINLFNNEQKVLFHLTSQGYTGKTARKIGLGDPRSSLVKVYGEPTRSVETPRGQIMVYQDILFIIGRDGKVERWATYR